MSDFITVALGRSNQAPYKEGIKTDIAIVAIGVLGSAGSNQAPYKEGIKTFLERLGWASSTCSNQAPYKEGIKTSQVTLFQFLQYQFEPGSLQRRD